MRILSSFSYRIADLPFPVRINIHNGLFYNAKKRVLIDTKHVFCSLKSNRTLTTLPSFALPRHGWYCLVTTTTTNMNRIQKRNLLHIPALLGMAGVKVFSLLLVKKALVYAVLRKYGIKKTFDLLRAANLQLRTSLVNKKIYSEEAYLKVHSSLNTLEELLLKAESLSLDEQAEVIVKKLSNMPELTNDLQQKVYEILRNFSNFEKKDNNNKLR